MISFLRPRATCNAKLQLILIPCLSLTPAAVGSKLRRCHGDRETLPYSSLWRRQSGCGVGMLSEGPVPRPADWCELVNVPQLPAELEAVRQSVRRCCPFGQEDWQKRTARLLGLEASLRPPGRPRKAAQVGAGA